MELFDYIEVFYNHRRRHSTLGQISAAEFEKRANSPRVDPVENCQERSFSPAPHGSSFSAEKTPQPHGLTVALRDLVGRRGMVAVARAHEPSSCVQEAERHEAESSFNDFFRANHAGELTVVCCAMDYVWAEEVAYPRYGVRFEQPTTRAAGGRRVQLSIFQELKPTVTA